jgi:hypothetical protein
MDTLWPWLALAGAGALHGINPAGGWVFCNGLRGLLPIAVGHVASVALVAAAMPAALALGLAIDTAVLRTVAGAILLAVVAHQLAVRLGKARRAPAGRTGLAMWSFGITTAHGAGLMLVPALVPLCLGDTPAREITASGSMLLALAAVGVHMAAMLAATAAMSRCARGGFEAARRRRRESPGRRAPPGDR